MALVNFTTKTQLIVEVSCYYFNDLLSVDSHGKKIAANFIISAAKILLYQKTSKQLPSNSATQWSTNFPKI
jgi:hypothetical protein